MKQDKCDKESLLRPRYNIVKRELIIPISREQAQWIIDKTPCLEFDNIISEQNSVAEQLV